MLFDEIVTRSNRCMPISTPPVTYQLERPGCSGIACGPYLSIRDPSNLERELPAQATGAVCVRGLPTFQGYEVDSDQSVPLDTSAFTSYVARFSAFIGNSNIPTGKDGSTLAIAATWTRMGRLMCSQSISGG